jgi:hypothetical protein
MYFPIKGLEGNYIPLTNESESSHNFEKPKKASFLLHLLLNHNSRLTPNSEFFFGDRVPFSASDSGSPWKCTNQSQSLPHFVAKKKFTEKQSVFYC